MFSTTFRSLTCFLLLCVCVLRSGQSFAEPSQLAPEYGYNHGRLETPRMAAVGGGLQALSNSIDALYANPANIAVVRLYHFAGLAQVWPDARRQSYGGAAVDSVVNRQRIAGAIGVHWSGQDPDGVDRTSLDIRFAAAVPLSDRLFVGAMFRHLGLKQDGYPQNDAIAPSVAASGLSGNEIVNDITFDVGVTAKLTEELLISAVGHNLTDPGHSFLPLMMGGGVGYGAPHFSIEVGSLFDFTSFDETKTILSGGAEFLAFDSFPVRAGYGYDEGLATHALSGGLGYLAREFSIEATVRGVVDGPRALSFLFGLKYHLDTVGFSAE